MTNTNVNNVRDVILVRKQGNATTLHNCRST